MSIKALPADACRLLGSTTVIATPASLVKELVENAIDAGATSVDVIVSPNTVDKIEIRDNGHGINPVDFDVLGRRGHTSKIRCFEDLKTLGGISLGFRGEGLASANTLGYVAITTRTSDEAIASTFRLVPATGGIAADSRKLVPAPIGTTVSVSCLFSNLPVRRKAAVQDAPKTMNAVKALLTGYAMARPHLRLSFKALKEAVPPWSYRPMTFSLAPNGAIDMKQAVVMLFGAEVGRQCQEIITSTDKLLNGQATLSQAMSDNPKEKPENFIFEAFLPRPDADLSKLRQGGYISVDGRPLTFHNNGIVDKLLAVFHTSFGRLLSQMGVQQPKVRGTFMRLNIRCPAGTYDANVDSSKTDVLFSDEKFLCDAFARLCAKTFVAPEPPRYQNAYGRYPPSTPVRSQPTLSFAGSASGRSPMGQSQTRPFQHHPSQDFDDGLVQGHIMTPITGNARVPPGRGARFDEQFPISQLDNMFTDSPSGAPAARRNMRSAGAIEYNFTSSRGAGAQRRGNSTASRHIRLSPIRKRAPIRSIPVRGLQTPPSSNPLEQLGRVSRNQGHGVLRDSGLTGMETDGGFRQTTISFGDRDLVQGIPADVELEQNALGESSRSSFMSARELYNQAQPDSPSHLVSTGANRHHTGPDHSTETVGQSMLGLTSARPSHSMPPRRLVHTLRVDQKQLRRSAAAFARNSKTWDEEPEYLSPETADISSIKSRLRAAIVDWLAKSREERKETGAGSVQVEFYLRKSLKKKALLVRDLGQK